MGPSWLDVLPDPVEWYFQPPKGRGTFTLLPWSAFVFAGAVLGTAIDGAAGRMRRQLVSGGRRRRRRRPLRGRRLGGAPADGLPGRVFLDDVAGLCCGASGAYAGNGGHGVAVDFEAMARSLAGRRRSKRFGAGSLFVYWVHVELVYGFTTRALRRQLTLEQGVVGWLRCRSAMYALLLGWNRLEASRGSSSVIRRQSI